MAFVYDRFDRGYRYRFEAAGHRGRPGQDKRIKSEEVAKNKTDENGELNGNHS